MVVLSLLACGGDAVAQCGNGSVDPGEDCDLGGTCIGGAAAGAACHVGDSTCAGGTCTTFGGQGCAANCTFEHDVTYQLVSGQASGSTVAPGTSGLVLSSDLLSIPIPFVASCDVDRCLPSQEVLTIGKQRDGKIPVAIKLRADLLSPVAMPVSTLACACIHRITVKTCGGSFFEPDGRTLSPNCTPGFSSCSTPGCDSGGEPCDGLAPCTFLHGSGNAGAGEIGCDGLDGIEVSLSQDAGGASGAASPAVGTVGGSGGPGSATILSTIGVTVALGPCNGNDPATYGPDGVYCTADDPPPAISSVMISPEVTGTATAVVHNANGMDGRDLGPVSLVGAPFNCAQLENGNAAGAGLVQAFPAIHLDTLGDVVVSSQWFAAEALPTPTPTATPVSGCTGDCDGNGQVVINEIITMVADALSGDSATAAACPGVQVWCTGPAVTIDCIIAAVHNALTDCPPPTPVPTPLHWGEACTTRQDCDASLFCTDGVCCLRDRCPNGTHCNVCPLEGVCVDHTSLPCDADRRLDEHRSDLRRRGVLERLLRAVAVG